MAFLAILLALSAVQLFGVQPLGGSWQARIHKAAQTVAGAVWVIGLPTLAVAAAYLWLAVHALWLALPLAAAVLWLSIASAAHKQAVEQFINAGRAEDWGAASEVYRQLEGAALVAEGDWQALNKAVLERAAYLGFCQFFAVLFWFCLLGPAAALGYRLLCISAQHNNWPPLGRFLWYVEWPAVRLLGLTFAFTGNFLTGIQRWLSCLSCSQRSSAEIITHYVLGALGVMEGGRQTVDVTRRELFAMARLLRRSLWFWLGALALLALRGW